MSSQERALSASKVLTHLADIESQGIEFYEALIKSSPSEWMHKVCRMMLKAEIRHRERFLSYAHAAETGTDADANTLTQPLPPDVARMLSERGFPRREWAAAFGKNTDDRQALRSLIRFEENLAVLLSQLAMYVPKAQHKFIERVTQEERAHQRKLEQVYQEHFD